MIFANTSHQVHYETRLFPEAFTDLSLAVSSCTVIDPSAVFPWFVLPSGLTFKLKAEQLCRRGSRPDLHLNQIPILSLERERRGWDYSTVCPWFSQGCVVIHMAYSCRSGLWSRLVDRDRGECLYARNSHMFVCYLELSLMPLNAPLALCQRAKCSY